jgi:hypothetical protein
MVKRLEVDFRSDPRKQSTLHTPYNTHTETIYGDLVKIRNNGSKRLQKLYYTVND